MRSLRWLAAALGLAAAAGAQTLPDRGETPLADLLEIFVLERELVAIDAAGGGQTTEDLHLGEQVRWTGSRGQVGVVLTDERVLAVATGSASWQEARYQRGESPPAEALLGDRVALVYTDQRVLGFDGISGNLLEYRLGPQEALTHVRVGENVGLAVTSRVALGLSPHVGGLFAFKLHLRERIETVDVRSNLATVRTDRRILIFKAPAGSWSVKRLDLSEGS